MYRDPNPALTPHQQTAVAEHGFNRTLADVKVGETVTIAYTDGLTPASITGTIASLWDTHDGLLLVDFTAPRYYRAESRSLPKNSPVKTGPLH